MKTCVKCLENKVPDDFHSDKTRGDGLRSLCKLCVSSYQRSRRARVILPHGFQSGSLTVIGIADDLISPTGRHRPSSVCLCFCGNTKVIASGRLCGKHPVKSCGCKWRKPRLTEDEASFRGLFAYYKNNAKKRDYPFLLNVDEFRSLTKGNCFYCGVAPSQLHTARGHKTKVPSYIYNGIDRVDNKQGYVLSNSVSCCKLCNYMKRESTQFEFVNHCAAIVKNAALYQVAYA